MAQFIKNKTLFQCSKHHEFKKRTYGNIDEIIDKVCQKNKF